MESSRRMPIDALERVVVAVPGVVAVESYFDVGLGAGDTRPWPSSTVRAEPGRVGCKPRKAVTT
jgi:hypothetical protein